MNIEFFESVLALIKENFLLIAHIELFAVVMVFSYILILLLKKKG